MLCAIFVVDYTVLFFSGVLVWCVSVCWCAWGEGEVLDVCMWCVVVSWRCVVCSRVRWE